MNSVCSSEEVDDTNCIEGKLDDINHNLYIMMKEPDFVMKMMATYGAINLIQRILQHNIQKIKKG